MKRNPKRRYAIAALLAFIVATSSFAFAATNTFTGTNAAGIGVGTVSGFTVSNVAWTFAADPTNLASVQFALAPTGATQVRARVLNSTGGALGTGWVTCTGTGPYTCTLGGTVSTLAAAQLEIAAAT